MYTINLNSWQIALLEVLIERLLKEHQDDLDSSYVKSLGGLLNVLASTRPKPNLTAEAMKDTHIPRREGEA